jgi:phosphatidylglycerophosphatase A
MSDIGKVERPRAGVTFWFATWFGTGLAPVAPATVATLVTLPLHFALIYLPSPLHFSIVVAMAIAGVVAADRLARDMNEHDPQIVVVDESVSILLALWIAMPGDWVGVVAVFVLFRLLDIFKPWPLRLLERLRPDGLGIMADDLAAAVIAGLAVRLLL